MKKCARMNVKVLGGTPWYSDLSAGRQIFCYFATQRTEKPLEAR